ncbi:MAG: hypothetical protein MK110_13765 [Fuerstiella sp.]|nr:hypothetical protein [Fuerstiella sp.]
MSNGLPSVNIYIFDHHAVYNPDHSFPEIFGSLLLFIELQRMLKLGLVAG